MDFNVVFTVRFRNERYMWRYELHPPDVILLHYLVKFEKPKMYVNTISAFSANYKIAVACIKLD